jgi:hypothetical protein
MTVISGAECLNATKSTLAGNSLGYDPTTRFPGNGRRWRQYGMAVDDRTVGGRHDYSGSEGFRAVRK